MQGDIEVVHSEVRSVGDPVLFEEGQVPVLDETALDRRGGDAF